MSGRGKSGILFFQRGPGPEFKFGKMKRVELQNHRRSSGTYRNLVGWGGGGGGGGLPGAGGPFILVPPNYSLPIGSFCARN